MKNNDNYYFGKRTDLADMIPQNTKKVFSVGCGAGITEKELKKIIPEVIGSEQNEEMAKEASKYLNQVITGDIEEITLPFKEGYFDCIIYADILEHLKNPKKLLIEHKKVLNDNGVLIISIPNIRFWYVIYSLLVKGDWKYADRGLFDRTHLRNFTYRNFKRLLKECGFKIIRIKRRFRLFEDDMGKYENLVRKFTPWFLKDFFTFQYILVADKNE